MPARKHHRRHGRNKDTRPMLRPGEKMEVDSLEKRLHGAPLPEKNKPSQPISPGAVEAKMFMEKARLAFEATQQEKKMTDIATALKTALENTVPPVKAAPPVKSPIPEVTVTPISTNLSRSVFEFIRDNPGLGILDIAEAFTKKGFRNKSVGSLIYQMIKVRLVVPDSNGKLTAVVREYVPINASLRRARKAPQTKPVVRKHTPAPAPIKAMEIAKTNTEVATPQTEEWNVGSVIDRLNVRQAMAVYDELRKIFGE